MTAGARKSGMEMFDLAMVPAVSWKNNRGLTRVVASVDYEGEMLWRVSVADIGMNGPFSLFPDTDRHSALLEGDRLELVGQEGSLAFDAVGDIHAYAGELPLAARLRETAVRLLNVMTRRDRASCRMQYLAGQAVAFDADHGAVLIAAGSYGLFHDGQYLTQVHAQQGLLVRSRGAAIRLVPAGADSALITMQIDLQ